jgi:hypothetical protein
MSGEVVIKNRAGYGDGGLPRVRRTHRFAGMNDMLHVRRIDPERRDALKNALNDEIGRGLAQIRSGRVADLDGLFDALERDLADDDTDPQGPR